MYTRSSILALKTDADEESAAHTHTQHPPKLDLLDRMDYTPLNYAWAGKHEACKAVNSKGDCQVCCV
jgi:hypothetical protein